MCTKINYVCVQCKTAVTHIHGAKRQIVKRTTVHIQIRCLQINDSEKCVAFEQRVIVYLQSLTACVCVCAFVSRLDLIRVEFH